MGTAICELRGVSKRYAAHRGLLDQGRRTVSALHDVDLRLGDGEILGLVGESGCGKTTLARIALGLEAPTAGRVFFSGRDISSLTRSGRRVFRRQAQMVFQDPFSSLNPKKTVSQILSEPLKIHGLCAGRQYRERAAQLLQEVGLGSPALDRYPHEFSGGQRQRIGLARALATQPRMIVADEPTSALDVSIQAQIINLLLDLQERHRLSYLFISHDLPVIQFVSHRVAVMYGGELVEIMPRKAFLPAGASTGTADHHPYTYMLLDAVPIPDPRSRFRGGRRRAAPRSPEPPGLARRDRCVFAGRCVHASARCSESRPPWAEVGPGHFIACHHEAYTSGKRTDSETKWTEKTL